MSEQTFLDCVTSPRYHSSGCNGGWTQEALDFAKNFGVEAEASYPYKTKQETCTFTANNIVLKGTGEVRIESGNAEALKNAVATQGPISVVLYASSKFQSYKSGVYYEPNCSKQCNHAVLAVGYGNEGGQDYWLLKNSWATWFGEAGYIKLARNKDNMCGILTDSHYPLV